MDPISELQNLMQRAVAAYNGPGMSAGDRRRLVEALRSGRYRQERGFAFEPNGRGGVRLRLLKADGRRSYTATGVADDLGIILNQRESDALEEWHWSGATFREIADRIAAGALA